MLESKQSNFIKRKVKLGLLTKLSDKLTSTITHNNNNNDDKTIRSSLSDLNRLRSITSLTSSPFLLRKRLKLSKSSSSNDLQQQQYNNNQLINTNNNHIDKDNKR